MNYKQARGAIPWKPGDEKPEATIRRLRNGEPKGMTMDKIDELIRNIETQAILLHDKSREKSLLMTDYTSSEAARATLRAEFKRLRQETSGICNWTASYDDEYWNTDCGQDFVLETGSPKENDMRFCSYCGKRLVEVIPPKDLEDV